MMNDIDTAAIRAARTLFGYGGVLIPDRDVEALCDALDAARAELDNCWQDRMEADQRSEAAEAQRDALNTDARAWMNNCGVAQANAEAAEVRIATALAWFADTDCTWTYRVEMARNALTEGTGQ